MILQGRLKRRSFETRDGEKRTVVEFDVDEVGPSLRYATVTVTKASRDGGNGSSGASGNGASGDVWASAPPAGAGVAAGGYYDEEPPF